ncbi:calmodulin-1-like [Mizuhopecten yessoensis]|uniref:calmodulin-1-like n=1 Tax=Mizuhopecten yessoensis TaxID=6573 RepID=UPI000B45ACB7|nr:calmodulin-1-like [Mizuhopecten yessoensis]
MAEALTDDQTAALREAFNKFDMDGNGSITVDELGLAMRSIGENPSTKEIRQLMEAADLNRNGTIEFEEFVEMVADRLKDFDVISEMKEAFEVFDQDNDGFLNKEDIRRAMAGLGVSLTEPEVTQMMEVADSDKDGRLNYKEFVAMLTRGDQFKADNILLSLKRSLTI